MGWNMDPAGASHVHSSADISAPASAPHSSLRAAGAVLGWPGGCCSCCCPGPGFRDPARPGPAHPHKTVSSEKYHFSRLAASEAARGQRLSARQAFQILHISFCCRQALPQDARTRPTTAHHAPPRLVVRGDFSRQAAPIACS